VAILRSHRMWIVEVVQLMTARRRYTNNCAFGVQETSIQGFATASWGHEGYPTCKNLLQLTGLILF